MTGSSQHVMKFRHAIKGNRMATDSGNNFVHNNFILAIFNKNLIYIVKMRSKPNVVCSLYLNISILINKTISFTT